jgi:hypothetical protein
MVMVMVDGDGDGGWRMEDIMEVDIDVRILLEY